MYNNGIKSGICKRSIESKKGWSPFDVDVIRCDLCQMKPLRSHSVDVINCLSKFVLCVQLTHLQSIRKLFILLPFKHEKRKALCCHSNMRKGRLFGTVHTFSSFSCLICCFVLSLYYCQFLYPNHIFWIVLLSSVYNFASRRHMLNLCNCV
jgi:hypothetical protein